MTTFEPGASEVLTHGFERSPRATALRARIPAPIITDGFEVFVQLVIAAITTWPWSSSKSRCRRPASARRRAAVPVVRGAAVAAARPRARSCGPPSVARAGWSVPLAGGSLEGKDSAVASSGVACRRRGHVAGERLAEALARVAQRDPVLRALRAGEARHDLAEVELEHVGEGRLVGALVVPQALLAWRTPRPARSARAGGPESSR